MLSKYAKGLLREVITEIENYPKAFDAKNIRIVPKSKGVPYRVVGNIPCKVLEVAGIDVKLLLESIPRKTWRYNVEEVANILLFGDGFYNSHELFDPDNWLFVGAANDPVKRIKHFLKTDGRQ